MLRPPRPKNEPAGRGQPPGAAPDVRHGEGDRAAGEPLTPASLLQLQRSAGNQAVAALVREHGPPRPPAPRQPSPGARRTLARLAVTRRRRQEDGEGPPSVRIWDTTWPSDQKAAALAKLDRGDYILVLERLLTFVRDPTVIGDLPSFIHRFVDADALSALAHNELLLVRDALTALPGREQDLDRVQQMLAKTISATQSGELPHRKTPGGDTKVINMNYALAQGGKRSSTDYEHFKFFAESAIALGLRLEILATANGKADIATDLETYVAKGLDVNVTIVPSEPSKWAEDSVEFLESGRMAVLEKFNDRRLAGGIEQGRRERWKDAITDARFKEAPFGGERNEWVPDGILVNAVDTGKQRETASGQQAPHLRAYIEGGNMISGEDAEGRRVILIGKDAIAATAGAHGIAPAMARQLMAEDFGVGADQIICVEQPGKFHLDMGLLFIGKGRVIVNDCKEDMERAKQSAAKMPDLLPPARLAAKLELQSKLENMAAQDLVAAGMTVLRKKLSDGTTSNFLNGEFVTDSKGNVHYLTNGAQKATQEEFHRYLVEELEVVTDVRFSPASAASESLKEHGGVGCRIKGAPKREKTTL